MAASQRASDIEREQAAAALREDLVAGRLTLQDFSDRLDQVFAASTVGELARTREDLPVLSDARHRRRPLRLTGAILGRGIRRGRLRLRRRATALSVLGDLDLDLREADIDALAVRITVLVAFGNADVYVPEGVDVEVGGVLLLGRLRHWGRDCARPGAPTIRVRVLGLGGTADVWRVPAEVQGGYGEITRALQQRQRQLSSPPPGSSRAGTAQPERQPRRR